MANVLSSSMLSPKMPGSTPAPQSRALDTKQYVPPPPPLALSTDEPDAKSSDNGATPDISKLRDAAVKLLLEPSASSSNVKRFWGSSSGTTVAAGPGGNRLVLSTIAQGSTDGTRVGSVTRIRRLYIRGTFTMDAGSSTQSTTSGTVTYLSQAPVVRFIILRDKFPVINTPAFVDPTDSNNPPSSQSGVYTLLQDSGIGLAGSTNGVPAAIRNFVTEPRYEVYRDELYTVGKQYAESSNGSSTGVIYKTWAGQHVYEHVMDLNFDQVYFNTTTGIMTNSLQILYATDWGGAGAPQNALNTIKHTCYWQLLFDDPG